MSVDVSIHAPTQGATIDSGYSCTWEKVSIHAPTQGATTKHCTNGGGISFNPRAHAGRDYFDHRVTNAYTVSIHAPTQGAT